MSDDDKASERNETVAEGRYRRRVGITLAVLAILGASIGLLQTSASTSESSKAREATRLAVEAQTAQVLAEGLDAAVSNAFARVESFESRSVFSDTDSLGELLGIDTDPEREAARLETAQDSLDEAFTGQLDLESLARTAAATELHQKAAVSERIEWNAKASQYETVLTVLAIAVFLVGFTLVIGRKLRPPVAVPGVALALYCVGWAAVIYSHPIPSVDDEAVEQTAAGEVALDNLEPTEAMAHFDAALETDPEYVPALSGRALARVLENNPDLLATLAVTSADPADYTAALEDLRVAMENGGDQDPRTLSIASLLALLAGEWDRASVFLDDASEANPSAAALYLWHAALEVAIDEPDEAQEWLERARADFSEIEASQRRAYVAQFLSLLEMVSSREPSSAELSSRITSQLVAAEAESVAGRQLEPGNSEGATLEVVEVGYDGGSTRARFALGGVADDAVISIVGYERPAPGADWVQPAELFYSGVATDVGQGVNVSSPRRCVPVEYRFDLYVEGELADTVTAPGATATC